MSKHNPCYDSAPAPYDSVLVKTLSQTAHACHGGFKDSTRAAMPARAEKTVETRATHQLMMKNPRLWHTVGKSLSAMGSACKGTEKLERNDSRVDMNDHFANQENTM